MKIIVLAGGGGTRLWPLSRQDFPKQFLHFGKQHSLLQQTAKRFLGVSFIEGVMVATNHQYSSLVQMQLKKIDPTQKIDVLIEPIRRNTAPAIALAVRYLQDTQEIGDDCPILVMPSDHIIEPEETFLQVLQQSKKQMKDRIVLFGIKPTCPETGYGYIQRGPSQNKRFYEVQRFVEKPNRDLALRYLEDENYFWNAGIFGFSPRVFWEEMKRYAPIIFDGMLDDFQTCVKNYSQLPDISLDYALLEKTKKASLCPMEIHWSDIGSWDSFYEATEKDQNQNVKVGNVHEINTKNSLIIGGKKLISTIGLEDVLIVDTDDAMFVTKKGESQKVKELVQELIKTGHREALKSSTEQMSWGIVKPLYNAEKYKVELVQIYPHQTFKYVGRYCIENWTLLSDEIEIRNGESTQRMISSQTFRIEQSHDLIIQNPLAKTVEALLICYELCF